MLGKVEKGGSPVAMAAAEPASVRGCLEQHGDVHGWHSWGRARHHSMAGQGARHLRPHSLSLPEVLAAPLVAHPLPCPPKPAKTPSTHGTYTRRCVGVFGSDPLGFLSFKYSRRCSMVVSGAVCIREMQTLRTCKYFSPPKEIMASSAPWLWVELVGIGPAPGGLLQPRRLHLLLLLLQGSLL